MITIFISISITFLLYLNCTIMSNNIETTPTRIRFNASDYVKQKENKDDLMDTIKKAEALNIVKAFTKTPKHVSILTSFYNYLFDSTYGLLRGFKHEEKSDRKLKWVRTTFANICNYSSKMIESTHKAKQNNLQVQTKA